MSCTTSADPSARERPPWRRRGTASSSSTSATRSRSGSTRRRRSCRTSSPGCRTAQGYSDSRGIQSARRAVVHHYQLQDGFPSIDIDDVWLGNGVSELISARAAGAARQRRRGAHPDPRLPAVDGGHQPRRRRPGALPVRRGERVEPRPRGPRVEDHRPHEGHRRHQPEQPHRRGLLARDPRRDRRARAQARPRADGRRDLRQDPLRRRRPHPARERRPGRADADVQRPVQGVPGVRLPGRMARRHRPARERAATTSRASRCWRRCGCAPTCRRRTPSRWRSAATRASRS